MEAKADVWIDCAAKKAAELDDGRSDAGTIAEGVRTACRSVFPLMDDSDKGFAINVVLKARSNAKNRTRQSDAQTKAAAEKWADCVVGGVYSEDDGVSSASAIASRIRPVCNKLYTGVPSDEYSLVVMAVEKVRAHNAQRETKSPPQRMPSTDLKF